MENLSAFVAGVGIGLSVTVPVGPTSIMCMSRAMNGGMWAGISSGAGASSVQVLYGSLVMLAFQQVGSTIEANRLYMGLASASVMLFFAWRNISQNNSVGSRRYDASVVRSFLSAAALNCVNPMLLLLLFGAIGAIVGPQQPTDSALAMLLLGVFIASIGWWIVLSVAIVACGRRLRPRMLLGINRVAAAGMFGFAALATTRAFAA
jgi:threonine/homoserine/homoserine lactone efflux protein